MEQVEVAVNTVLKYVQGVGFKWQHLKVEVLHRALIKMIIQSYEESSRERVAEPVRKAVKAYMEKEHLTGHVVLRPGIPDTVVRAFNNEYRDLYSILAYAMPLQAILEHQFGQFHELAQEMEPKVSTGQPKPLVDPALYTTPVNTHGLSKPELESGRDWGRR